MIASPLFVLTALPHAHRYLRARIERGRSWWVQSRERWDDDLRAWQEGAAG